MEYHVTEMWCPSAPQSVPTMINGQAASSQPLQVPAEEERENGASLLTFGKHRGRSFATVCHEDPDYCAWAMAQPQPSPAMAEFVRYLDSLGLSDVFAAKRRRRSVATPARNTVQHAPLERPNRTSWMTWMTLEGANGLQQQAPPPRDSPPQWAPGIHPAYLAAAQAAPAAPAAAAPAVAPSGQFGGWKQGVQMEHETRSFQPRGHKRSLSPCFHDIRRWVRKVPFS